MKRTLLAGMVCATSAAGLLALAGCSQEPQANDKICLAPPPLAEGDWGACVHRWAYKLAPAPGSNREIADAALAGCAEVVSASFDKSARAAAYDAAGDPATGGRDAELAKDMVYAGNRALFHVVQARAGHCDIP